MKKPKKKTRVVTHDELARLQRKEGKKFFVLKPKDMAKARRVSRADMKATRELMDFADYIREEYGEEHYGRFYFLSGRGEL